MTATRGWSGAGPGPGDPGPARFTQVQIIGDAAVAVTADALEPGPVPLLTAPDGPDLAGRAQVTGQAAAELANGMSVQLYGPAGAGKKAVARAVLRRLAAGPGTVAGAELRPAAGRPHTLESLYERLAGAFFRGTTVGPAEGPLRAAVAGAGLAAVIVIGDCELAAPDLARLLETFGGCAFLLTSRHRTLYRSGATHEIGPLPLDAAIEVMARRTGQDLAAVPRLQAAQAYNNAAGQAGRLLQYAAYLEFTAGRPGHDPLAVIPAAEQAATLAAGLPPPARRALTALATFGAEIPPDCFAAVTGQAADGAGADLLASALVTEGADGYRITPDAAAAVAGPDWTPASPVMAGRGLLEYLGRAEPEGAPPGPGLLAAVAARLHAAGEDLLASRLIRTALPEVLRAGQVRDWMNLVALGLRAASAAGASADLAYFAQEDSVRRVLLGQASADPGVIAAEAVTAAAMTQPGTAGPGRPPGPGAPGRRAERRRRPEEPGQPGRPARRRAVRLGAVTGVALAAAAGVIAALVLTGTPTRTTAGPASPPPASAAVSAPPTAPASHPPPRHPRPRPASPSPRHSAAPSRTARPSPRPSSRAPGPSPSARPGTPAAVVQAYFAAINARDYQAAWNLGGDNLSPSFAQFKAGFAGTAQDLVTVIAVVGGSVLVNLTAVQSDGSRTLYTGAYQVSGGVITGSDVQRVG